MLKFALSEVVFKFALGEVVCIAPVPSDRTNRKALVIGQTVYLDGSVGYVVSTMSLAVDGVVRHTVTEFELQKVPE